jgi:hypothetical protein
MPVVSACACSLVLSIAPDAFHPVELDAPDLNSHATVVQPPSPEHMSAGPFQDPIV